MDNIRILRIIEYSGPRDLVETQIVQSLHGEKRVTKPDGRSFVIRAATVGVVAEILADLDSVIPTTVHEPYQYDDFTSLSAKSEPVGICPDCGELQYTCNSGFICVNGHGF